MSKKMKERIELRRIFKVYPSNALRNKKVKFQKQLAGNVLNAFHAEHTKLMIEVIEGILLKRVNE